MGERGVDRSAAEALAGILALVCVVAGLVSGRPETVALAAPFALLVVAGRAAARATARDRTDTARQPAVLLRPDGHGEAGPRTRLVVVPARAGRGPTLTVTILAAPGSQARALVLSGDEECPLLVDGPPSGEADTLVCTSAELRPELSRLGGFVQAPPVRISVLPPVGRLLPRPVSARLHRSTGSHVSRRPGEGTELRTIAPLQAGDRLRRIDWRATARRSTDQDRLMVRRTLAEAEASVYLVLDTAHDLPDSTVAWFAARRSGHLPGSLHRARTAAAEIAGTYLAGGDRVGLDDLSGSRRSLRSAAGSRHLEQIRARLAATVVTPRRRRRRDPVPPQGSFVVLLSAFLDDEPGRLLELWHAQGHLVAGVDCAPMVRRTELSRAQTSAVRLTLLKRALRLERMRDTGIPVLAATSAGESSPQDGTARPGADTGLETGLRVLSRQRRRTTGRRMP